MPKITKKTTMKILTLTQKLFMFWTTELISMTFSEKAWFTIILKVKKKNYFYPFFRRSIFQKPSVGVNWPPSRFRVKANPAAFFLAGFNLLRFELKHSKFRMLY